MKPDGRVRMANQYIVFVLDGQRYAMHLSAVDRVVRMVHITPLSSAPDILLGVVDVGGRIVPVIDVRQRFNLPKRDLSLSDRLIFARTERRSVALVADAVTDVVECSEHSLVPADHIVRGLKHIEGIIRCEDGLILIHDLDTFLSLDEEQSLDLALGTS
ncbi:CheW protein [Nitrosovibrio sp. Nv4]|uniref:chemotaxis protein CheW n=2 Tax=Nitrosovibrio sp. Nv4 TaxID=1945880 RepID=UPI000BD8FD0C|nr:chemotaxis protein CheW [Nitrosovibrio sp. Nv4]SOD41096.1 CheW protein [Nitrosovibrio sp. Nv4]